MTGSEKKLERSSLIRLGADLIRLSMGLFHSYQAWQELGGKVAWVYERFAIMQALGWIFQRKSVPWILETSGIFFYEAATERKSIALSGVARTLELWAYRKCDVLICVTEVLKELLVEIAGIAPDKILVVPNGVDTARFDAALYHPQRLFDGLTIGFVGSLINWHRLDVLLHAMAELKQEGIHLNLVVVGDGPMREAWENEVQLLHLEDNVCFVGRVAWTEVPSYIAGFDLGYMGYSHLEMGKMYGSPLKLYEYMAMALPVVSSTCEDARDMIIDGQNGYLFEPGDKEDLKRVLLLAIRDQARWSEIGKAARRQVLEKASWRSRVEAMITAIEAILEAQGANPSA
ncbi:MAG TPA: glycosyltransferase family 4 protein [Anaerolineales bacterium]|nr:glycosyltransferase family 4 protein [Anaerolineales bacterium]